MEVFFPITEAFIRSLGRGFRFNVDEFRGIREDLRSKLRGLRRQVEEAENKLHEIRDDVRDLLEKAEIKMRDMESMEEAIYRSRSLLRRYRLNIKFEKEKLVIHDLLKKIDKIYRPGEVGYPLRETISTFEFLSSEDLIDSEASKIAFSQVMETLKGFDDVSMIGLWGMGGLGKTTLVRLVGRKAAESRVFDKVVITTVSQRPNFHTIQDDIAKELGFHMNGELGRRSETDLWLRLQKEWRILIILDDVWEEINLKESIGIPLGINCRVLLTTTRLQVCRSMECQKVVQLGFLDEKEAWALFEKKVGLIENSHDAIQELAGQIVKKCQGLPSAIVTLANSLKGNTNRHMWEATYRRLQSRRLVDTEGINCKNAYQCIEVSFDYLKSKDTKICFLLCSLFPQGSDIYVEDLVRFAWGLELFKGVESIEELRIEVLAAIDVLVNSCLLFDSGGQRHVKMHSFVRDVALWIASSRKEISFSMKSEVVQTLWRKDENFEPYTAIYFKTNRMDELPKGMVCPNLKLLSLGGDDDGEFLEEMKELKVCSLDDGLITTPETCEVRSLRLERCKLLDVSTLGRLTNLRTLHLECCKLPDISTLGNLKKLHVLSLSWSDIKELPEELGGLNDLKLLDISNCGSLKGIPPHLIRSLSKLEELYLHRCRLMTWAIESTTPEKRKYASLSELNSMQNLTLLSLQVAPGALPKEFAFRRLNRYDICIDEDILLDGGGHTKKDSQNSSIMRSLKIEASAVDACKQLFRDVESLNLKILMGYENLVPRLELDHQGFNRLTSLELESCKYMKYLIDTTNQHAATTSFSNLVNLSLRNLLELEGLCYGDQPPGFLQKLKTLSIHNCKRMIGAIPILQNLERLEVTSGDGIQVLFQNAELQSTQQQGSLKSLKIVQINSCNKLTYLFPATVAGSLGQLEKLKIDNCLKLEQIIQTTDQVQIIRTTDQVSLQSLREVYIRECDNLTSLESLSHGGDLKSLTSLHIFSCTRLENIFPTSMAKYLRQLNEIRLEKLPQLKGMDETNTVLTLPSLQKLTVTSCPQLLPFTISAKIQELWFEGLTGTSTKQLGSKEAVPESANTGCLTVDNFEELFDGRYNLISLKQLGLCELPELRVVWKGPIDVVNFGNLTLVDVVCCRRLKYIFSPTIARNLPQLSSLRIIGCDELKQVIEEDETSSSQDHHQPICFPNLTSIEIESCAKLKSLFPVTVAHGLPKLKRLIVHSVSKLEKVFIEKGDDKESTSEDREKVIRLLKLDTLRLEELPTLKSFSPMAYHFVLPSLMELEVRMCPNFDYKKWRHAKTETIRSNDENIVEDEDENAN